MPTRSSLQANQLLAGLQQREPKLHDLIRAIIKDLQDINVQVTENTNDLNTIKAGTSTGSGLTHGQVMQRISSGI